MQPAYRGELMLASWKETHNGGATVTFWLPEPSNLDLFRGLTVKKGNTAGQRFAAILVELNDDETTKAVALDHGHDEHPNAATGVGEPQSAVAADCNSCSGGHVAESRTGPLCQSAGILCKDIRFQTFLDSEFTDIAGEEDAAAQVRKFCGVTSRREIDGNPQARAKFAQLMQSYSSWIEKTSKHTSKR